MVHNIFFVLGNGSCFLSIVSKFTAPFGFLFFVFIGFELSQSVVFLLRR